MFVLSNERRGKCTGREIWICSWDPFPCCIVSRIELIGLTYYKQVFEGQRKESTPLQDIPAKGNELF